MKQKPFKKFHPHIAIKKRKGNKTFRKSRRLNRLRKQLNMFQLAKDFRYE